MNEIAERPILFSASMVRAILKDRKTQTARIVKPKFGAIDNNYGDVKESEKFPGEWFQGKKREIARLWSIAPK